MNLKRLSTLFHVVKTDTQIEISYVRTLRNFLLYQQLKHTGGVPSDLPVGHWIMTFSWEHSRLIPGLMFNEA